MPKPDKLPQFDGWQPLGYNEPMRATDKLVYWPRNADGLGHNSYFYHKGCHTPEGGLAVAKYPHWFGRPASDNDVKGSGMSMNPDFYPYRWLGGGMRTLPPYPSNKEYAQTLPLP